LNYNGKRSLAKLLDECLFSVLKTDYSNFEVIFVDNGSTDGSVKYVKNLVGKNPRVKIIALDKNYGFTGGNNLGCKYINTSTEYIVFLNTDAVVKPDWLKKLLKVMEGDKNIGAAQPSILNPDGSFQWAGLITIFADVTSLEKPKNDVFEITYASGAALIIRRIVWEEIGGFNEDYFLYFDDADLSWRVWLRGFRVVCISQAQVYHYGSMTKKRFKRRLMSFFHDVKNRYYSMLSNYELVNAVKYTTIRFMGDVSACLVNIVLSTVRRDESRAANAMAYLKAFVYIFTNMRRIALWRRKVQSSRRIRDRELIDRAFLKPKPCLPFRILRFLKRIGLKTYPKIP